MSGTPNEQGGTPNAATPTGERSGTPNTATPGGGTPDPATAASERSDTTAGGAPNVATPAGGTPQAGTPDAGTPNGRDADGGPRAGSFEAVPWAAGGLGGEAERLIFERSSPGRRASSLPGADGLPEVDLDRALPAGMRRTGAVRLPEVSERDLYATTPAWPTATTPSTSASTRSGRAP